MSLKTYIQLSDLHFGAKGAAGNIPHLQACLKDYLRERGGAAGLGFIVTGDAVDSPSRENNADYLDFSAWLRGITGTDPFFVLGNHDVSPYGLAFWRKNQMLIDSVGSYPRLAIDETAHVAFLLFDSNTSGVLAQGEIGADQMEQADRLLAGLKDREGYMRVAVLHHHLVPIDESDSENSTWWRRLIPDWFERLLPGLFNQVVELRDAPAFINFLKEHDIRFVLHGHKHLPFVREHEGIHIIACGSSTARPFTSDPRKTCLSYNVLEFGEQALCCRQYADNLHGEGLKLIYSREFPLHVEGSL